jgi:hypothetical protein
VASPWVAPSSRWRSTRAAATNRALADAYAANVLPVIREIRRAGAKSFTPNRRCSERSRDHHSSWRYAKSVSNVLARALDQLVGVVPRVVSNAELDNRDHPFGGRGAGNRFLHCPRQISPHDQLRCAGARTMSRSFVPHVACNDFVDQSFAPH